jgi:hypothetical protein
MYMTNANEKLYELSGYGDQTLVSKSDLYKAIDEFMKRWDGEIVDPIEIRSLIRRIPASIPTQPPCTNEYVAEGCEKFPEIEPVSVQRQDLNPNDNE